MRPERELRPGDVLAGKYRVERVLGSGGMGVVVAARHLQLDERVALKFLRQKDFPTQGDVDRFLREARAAVKIKGEHVTRVHDVGTLEDGAPYIVMEYLEGEDLAALLDSGGPMPVTQAVDFVLQACEAIAEAHSLGIVHRDLKPANLFCIERPDGRLAIKVLDFGISKIITPDPGAHVLTQTADLIGSPLYMSPEQMKESKAVDSRTDIWSLGIILFQLVTGRLPFVAEQGFELAIKIATEPAPGLREFRANAPAALEQIVARCLEKDRSSRFQSVGELAVALASLGSSRAKASVDRIVGTLQRGGRSRDEIPITEPRRAQSPISAASATSAPSSVPWGEPPTDPGGARGWRRAAVVTSSLAALSGVAVLLFFLLRPGTRVAGQAPAPIDARVQAADDVAPSASSSQLAPPPPPQAPPTSSSSLVPEATPPSATRRPSNHPPTRVSPPRTEPPARPASTTQCDPPYTIDARGHHVAKQECL